MVALNRVQKLVKSMIGVVIAEASLLKFALRLHLALADWEDQAVELLHKRQKKMLQLLQHIQWQV